MQRSLSYLILLLAISSVSLFFRLGALPLSGADEPRYARIAQEMHEHGVWVTPLLEGKPWLEKPPLYYWITGPFYSLFRSNETAARLGPAVCALISALAIFLLGSAVWTRQAGLFGGVILLTSLGFAGFGRAASTDMPFACCFTLALAILAAAAVKDLGRKVLAAYLFLGLAVLAKGPAALILVAGIGLFVWFLDERGILVRRWRVLPGIVITAAVAIPWFWLAFLQNGYSFVAVFFINHNLARYVTDIHHHPARFYFYLPVLLALFFPWSGWLALPLSGLRPAGLRGWRRWHPGMLFLVCWTLFPILFFSLSESKLAGYILPSLPPLALILGVLLSRRLVPGASAAALRSCMTLHLVISAAMAAAALYYFQHDYGGNWKIGLLLSVAIIVPALVAFIFGIQGDWLRAFSTTAFQGLAVLMAVILFAFPVLGAYHSTKDIAQRALSLQQAGEPIITYRFFHHSLNYYTGYRIEKELDDLEALRRFVETHPSSLAVTDIDGLRAISQSGEFSTTLLCRQGNSRLLRITPKK